MPLTAPRHLLIWRCAGRVRNKGGSRQVRSSAGHLDAAGGSDAACTWQTHDRKHAIAMSKDDDLDPFLDRLDQQLPELLRKDWVVMPKHTVNQYCIICLVLGAATALMIVGWALDIAGLRWTWPAVAVSLMAARKYWPWWRGDRYAEQLRQAMREGAASPSEAAADAASRS